MAILRHPSHCAILRSTIIGAACWLAGLSAASAADFAVTSPGFFYSFNGTGNNPTITLVRGKTYTFAVTTSSFHPFAIIGAPPENVTGNDTSSGTITFVVPPDDADYSYVCTIHGFGGQIVTVPPPTPPVIQILNLSVGSNIVLTSTGTNNWSVIPEFNTNLATTNWFALTVQTNTFANGTNETICGRPDSSNVFIRVKSLPN